MTGYINGPCAADRRTISARRAQTNPNFSRNVAALPAGRRPEDRVKQLTLDLRADAPPVLENFVAASNADLLAALYEAVPVAEVQIGRAHV